MTDEEKLLQLQNYQPIQPKVDLGVKPVTAAPQNDLATQMATLMAQLQSSPGGGTVTVNQPAVAPTAPVEQPRVPPITTTAPVNTPDPMAALASNIGEALKQPTPQPTAPVSPADAAANYALEKTKATDQFYTGLQAEDQANNANIASQRVAQEFPGQTPSMFPEGLSKTLAGGETFRAMPSGGYAIAGTAAGRDAEIAARKANYDKNIAQTSSGIETAKRADLFSKLNPIDRSLIQSDARRGSAAGLSTEELQSRVGIGQRIAGQEARYQTALRRSQTAPRPLGGPTPTLAPGSTGYRPTGAGGRTDAMNDPNILRAIVANNRYDVAIRQRAQQKLRQMRL